MSSDDEERAMGDRLGYRGKRARLRQYELDLAYLPKWFESKRREYQRERKRLMALIRGLKDKSRRRNEKERRIRNEEIGRRYVWLPKKQEMRVRRELAAEYGLQPDRIRQIAAKWYRKQGEKAKGEA